MHAFYCCKILSTELNLSIQVLNDDFMILDFYIINFCIK